MAWLPPQGEYTTISGGGGVPGLSSGGMTQTAGVSLPGITHDSGTSSTGGGSSVVATNTSSLWGEV